MGIGKDSPSPSPSEVSMRRSTESLSPSEVSLRRATESLKILIRLGLQDESNLSQDELKKILDDPEITEGLQRLHVAVVDGACQAVANRLRRPAAIVFGYIAALVAFIVYV
ncbi:hypothetical protein FRX31_025328 [Thalictrum thalictroides]|uniref:Transmembrane protein n=1 Tax=Thalictrum thalictroides TaxID=46969 RepID=A0A7J6VJ06_THATH|nr:hypothetical protein FRX31_025328 [Thalictrum thalictroides]